MIELQKIKFMKNTNNHISSYEQNDFCSDFEKIIKDVKPKLIVEFGILKGYSLQAFVDFSDASCQINAYDLFDDFPYNAADYTTITDKFKNYDNITVEKLDFFEGYKKYENGTIDILHIDIANNGDVYQFAVEKYMDKISNKGAMILEGGSRDRDEIGWMNEFNKRKIHPYLEEIKEKYNITIIEKYPSITIITNKNE